MPWELGWQLRKGRKYLLLSFYSFTKAEETLWFSLAQGSLKSCHFDVNTEKSFSKNCSQVSGYAKREQTETDEDARILKWLVRDLKNEHSQ